MPCCHLFDFFQFVIRPQVQQLRMRVGGYEAIVDNSRPRLNARAAQIRLEIGSFKHRSCLRQCHQQHLALFLVLQEHSRVTTEK